MTLICGFAPDVRIRHDSYLRLRRLDVRIRHDSYLRLRGLDVRIRHDSYLRLRRRMCGLGMTLICGFAAGCEAGLCPAGGY